MDPMQLVGNLGGWVVAIIVAGFTLLPKKGSLENLRIDQLQEDIQAERDARKELDAKVERMDHKLDNYRRRDLAWMRHYAAVQRGVENGTVPPWPDFPAILREEEP